jgi:hypothetical protein
MQRLVKDDHGCETPVRVHPIREFSSAEVNDRVPRMGIGERFMAPTEPV